MVDMHTIGAGGGSIARVDAGGMLLVGPESAGAAPGPACYGLGGREPAVTDANLVLGHLSADEFLGGRMRLDRDAALRAMAAVAGPLGLPPEEAALGVIQVANEHMARALRVISVQRGVDPRGFTLVSFGGAGGMHVCALADALDMKHTMVPIQAGVLSALGMLVSRPGRQLSRTWLGLLRERGDGEIEARLQALAEQGRQSLIAEGVEPGSIGADFSLDLRYRGQSYTLNTPWNGRSDRAAADFAERHELRYGHRLDLPVEMVNLRASVSAPALALQLAPGIGGESARPARHVPVYGIDAPVPVWLRDTLAAGTRIAGPAVIAETVATTWLAPGWRCEVDGLGNLLLERAG
jgi:N-methylhydantoinase A